MWKLAVYNTLSLFNRKINKVRVKSVVGNCVFVEAAVLIGRHPRHVFKLVSWWRGSCHTFSSTLVLLLNLLRSIPTISTELFCFRYFFLLSAFFCITTLNCYFIESLKRNAYLPWRAIGEDIIIPARRSVLCVVVFTRKDIHVCTRVFFFFLPNVLYWKFWSEYTVTALVYKQNGMGHCWRHNCIVVVL